MKQSPRLDVGAALGFTCADLPFPSEGAGLAERRFCQRFPCRDDAEEEEDDEEEVVAEGVGPLAEPCPFSLPLRCSAYSSHTRSREMSERVDGTTERSLAASAASLNAGFALANMQSAAAVSVM